MQIRIKKTDGGRYLLEDVENPDRPKPLCKAFTRTVADKIAVLLESDAKPRARKANANNLLVS